MGTSDTTYIGKYLQKFEKAQHSLEQDEIRRDLIDNFKGKAAEERNLREKKMKKSSVFFVCGPSVL